MRQHGSPDLTYTDFVVVQSTWGMTQGFIMPLSGFLINAIGQKVIVTQIVSLSRYGAGVMPSIVCSVHDVA